MNRYKVTKQLGDGTYGSVLKATHRQTGEVVRNHSRIPFYIQFRADLTPLFLLIDL